LWKLVLSRVPLTCAWIAPLVGPKHIKEAENPRKTALDVRMWGAHGEKEGGGRRKGKKEERRRKRKKDSKRLKTSGRSQ